MEKYPNATIIGLGLRKISENYKVDNEIPLIPTGWCGTNAIEHTLYKHKPDISIGVGFVGALQDNLKRGDVIVPNKSISGRTIEEFLESDSTEGGLDHREEFSFKPNSYLNNFIVKELWKNGYDPKLGKIFQVSGLQMESNEVIKILHDRDYIGLEMETATLFGNAKNKGYQTSAILIVSDYQWPVGKRDKINNELSNEKFYPLVDLSIEILKTFISKGE